MKNIIRSLTIKNEPRQKAFVLALIVILSASQGIAQEQALKTRHLEIAYYKTTTIVFPSAIRNVDRGSKDILVQKAGGTDNILQLKAGRMGFQETNITVITDDGMLHHFIVTYDPQPDELVIDISPQMTSSLQHPTMIFSSPMTETIMGKCARDIVAHTGKRPMMRKRSHKLALSLKGIYIRKDKIFFHLEIANKSNMDYDIGALRFHIRDTRQIKRTATQEEELHPVFVHGDMEMPVKGHSESVLVCALEKFTIQDGKHLIIQLYERKGGRDIDLSIRKGRLLKAEMIAPTSEK